MRIILLLIFTYSSAKAFDNSRCIKNFDTVKKKHPTSNYKYFKCADKELVFDGKKVTTLSCSGNNGNFKYPEKINDNQYVSVVASLDKFKNGIILRVFYNAQGQLTRIRESKDGWDKDFFSSSISFKHINGVCVADEFFKGAIDQKKDRKYIIDACVDWEDYLDDKAKRNELNTCIDKLQKVAEIHDKYYDKDAFIGTNYISRFAGLSKPVSRLEENCRVIAEEYDLYDSVKVIKESRNNPETIVKPERIKVKEE